MVTRRRMFLLKVKLDIVLVDIRRIVFNYIIIYVPTSWYIKLEVGLGIFGSRHVHPLCFYTVAGNGISLLTNCILHMWLETTHTCSTSKWRRKGVMGVHVLWRDIEIHAWTSSFKIWKIKLRFYRPIGKGTLLANCMPAIVRLERSKNQTFCWAKLPIFSFSGFYVCKTAHMQLYNSSICRNLDFICLSGVSSASVPKYTSREFSAGQSSISNLCSQRCLQHLSQSSYAFTETSLMVT